MTAPKRTITRNQYLQLVGLKVLADQANARLAEVFKAAIEITQEPNAECGHTSDVFYGNHRDLDEALPLLGLEVEP